MSESGGDVLFFFFLVNKPSALDIFLKLQELLQGARFNSVLIVNGTPQW
jgi:hypothetical protein